jgi:uncharacterized membrane protein
MITLSGRRTNVVKKHITKIINGTRNIRPNTPTVAMNMVMTLHQLSSHIGTTVIGKNKINTFREATSMTIVMVMATTATSNKPLKRSLPGMIACISMTSAIGQTLKADHR